jgi:cytochrome b subunit of formate dehydrogenase/5-methylcytosine-specific restriction endonuclease McrA
MRHGGSLLAQPRSSCLWFGQYQFWRRRRLLKVFGAVLFLAGCALAAQKPSNDECLACHQDSSLTTEANGNTRSAYVNPTKFKDSIHGQVFSCVDCHTDIKSVPHQDKPGPVTCAACHGEAKIAYDRSSHARAKASGGPAAGCADCHGNVHEILAASDPKSRTHHANIPFTCGSCHNKKFVMEASGRSTQPFLAYQESVHGQAVARGMAKAAVCTDCHGAHEILSPADSKSSIFKFTVPATCGKCHSGVQKEFDQSIHGRAIARGEWQAPVCTDCHGIHSIKSSSEPNSPVSMQNLAQQTCARCHEGVRLSEEFGFESGRVSTYLASYHGLASKRGSAIVANCASCHGAHDILPSSDPKSRIHPANLVSTCGQCHRGVTEKFVAAKVHVNAPLSADTGSIVVRWVRRFYILLIAVVIGGMLVHNFVIWRFKAILRHRQHSGHTVVRMDRAERIQHNVLFISFTILVLTGFALKFPDSWFTYLVFGMSESLRGIVHRIAGVVLIGAAFYHVAYVLFHRQGRRMLRDISPFPTDARDLWNNLRYHLGLIPAKPHFGRFNYSEKIEYWALVWGTIVMALTGVFLWAKITVGNHLPRWWLDVATAVHFYEALLATIAIIIWHFYQVFFDPDTYPMNWAWWDGQVPLEHYRAEHPLDTETTREAVADGVGEPSQQAADSVKAESKH